MQSFFSKNLIDRLWLVCLLIVFLIAFVIRINNVFRYNSWWADDGGAHIGYVEHILNYGSLPRSSENYLAWHEPLYYVLQAGWTKLGLVLGISNKGILDWQEFAGVILFGIFIYLVYKLTLFYTKNRWQVLLSVLVFSVLFVGVKISAYVNNEFLVQILIILLVLLFYRLKLLQPSNEKSVVWWSVILGLAMLVKMTAVLILLSIIVIWVLYFIIEKKKHVLVYALLCIAVVGAINLPWLLYKETNFGSAFSINLYEQTSKQNILRSQAWEYLFKINLDVFKNDPFWISGPYSFGTILLADTFTDYYNLFNNVDETNNLSLAVKTKTSNGRYTTPILKTSALWSNRLGLMVAIIWLVGIIGATLRIYIKKQVDWQKLFLLILIFGGIFALVYNNLRLPYPERGVLKAHFIFYVFPLIALISFDWWWKILEKKLLIFLILFMPIIIYTIVAMPILFI